MWYHKLGHVLPPFIFFIASMVIFLVIRGNSRLDALDRVTLYKYAKATVNRDKALWNSSQGVAWLKDQTDADHCLDMTALNQPVAKFVTGSDPTGPTCQILLGTEAVSGNVNALRITPSFSEDTVRGCEPGQYAVEVFGGASGPVSGTTLYIGIQVDGSGADAVTKVSVTVPGLADITGKGYTPASRTAWANCLKRRVEMAMQFVTNTSCEQDSSQLCSCVWAFAGKLTDPSRKLAAVLPNRMTLQDALLGGVDKCIQLRRVHDVRTSSPGVYLRSWALFSFAMALFFNSVIYLVDRMPSDKDSVASSATVRVVVHAAFYLVLFAAFANGADGAVVATILVPISLLLIYDLYVEIVVTPDLIGPRPYLHPVAFSVCLCNLTLFTLVERGVVQTEYLLVEVVKCHAISAVYAANAWYHRYRYQTEDPTGRGGDSAHGRGAGLLTSNVENAQRLLVVVALAAAADTLLLPYPSKLPFQLHWLLPLVFVYIAMNNPSWAHALLHREKHNPSEPENVLHKEDNYHYLNSQAAALVFSMGLVLMGYFVVDHIRAYGPVDFAYPSYLSQADGGLPLMAHAM